jgi:hypothetical protein
MHAPAQYRVRYPLRAKLAIALAVCFFLAELVVCALWLMPLVPLVPVFIAVMVGNGFVIASVVDWASSVARSEAVKPRLVPEAAKEAERPDASQVANAT